MNFNTMTAINVAVNNAMPVSRFNNNEEAVENIKKFIIKSIDEEFVTTFSTAYFTNKEYDKADSIVNNALSQIDCNTLLNEEGKKKSKEELAVLNNIFEIVRYNDYHNAKYKLAEFMIVHDPTIRKAVETIKNVQLRDLDITYDRNMNEVRKSINDYKEVVSEIIDVI